MNDKRDSLQLRQIGKGFILNQMGGIVGRILTQTYMDKNKRTYVKINGEYVPLTEEHGFLSAN